MISMDTLTIKTENKFRSLITKQAYKKGDVICEIPTEKVLDMPNRYTVQIAQDRHTHVGKLAALNHSCDPNVILDTEHLLVYACKDIEKGEELSFFYPATEWHMAEAFACECGEVDCLGRVAGASQTPADVLARHALSPVIRVKLAARDNAGTAASA